MADVIDIIHNLSFNADISAIEALTKEFSKQFEQIAVLQKQLSDYEQALGNLGKNDAKNKQAINALIAEQKGKINEVTATIGQQFSANEKLTKSFTETNGKLKSLTQAGTQFAASTLSFGTSMKDGLNAIAGAIPDLLAKLSEAKSSGASTKDIFMALGSSLFSMTGLITLGVQALALFGDALFDSGEDAKLAEEYPML